MSFNESLNLKEGLKKDFEETGFLDKLRAQVRLEVVKNLRKGSTNTEGPGLSSDNFILNELIREYLQWNEYQETSKMLIVESGQPKVGMTRRDLERTLGVTTGANAGQVPLIYSILSHVKHQK